MIYRTSQTSQTSRSCIILWLSCDVFHLKWASLASCVSKHSSISELVYYMYKFLSVSYSSRIDSCSAHFGYTLFPLLKGIRHVPSVWLSPSYCHHLSLSLKILITKICFLFSMRKHQKQNGFFYTRIYILHIQIIWCWSKKTNSFFVRKIERIDVKWNAKYTKCMWKACSPFSPHFIYLSNKRHSTRQKHITVRDARK